MAPPAPPSGAAPSIRAVVVDDDPSLCRLLEIWVADEGDIDVVACADRAEQALAAAAAHRPDVVLLDVCLPDVDDPTVLVAGLRERAPDAALVLVSGLPDPIVPGEAMRLGFDDHVVKTASAEAVRDVVRRAARTPAGARLELDIPRDAGAPALARRRLSDRFADEATPAAVERLRLVASELVTNAIVHGSGPIRLRAEAHGDRVRIEVTDAGRADVPQIRPGEADDPGGWGLQVVDELALRWGVMEGSTRVWAELPLDR